MEHECTIDCSELDTGQLRSLIQERGDFCNITCLIGTNDTDKQDLLKQQGFRYAGKRLVEGMVVSVYTRFKDVSEPYEEMGQFFDRRARDYDLHMQDGNTGYETSFITLFNDIPPTGERIRVLDLGCGTGAELRYLFDKAPEARVTGIDVSELMLERLLSEYRTYQDQISLLQASYLDTCIETESFDTVVACSTLHHLLPDEKLKLFRNVRDWLKPHGKFLIQDYIAPTREVEHTRQEEYRKLIADGVIDPDQLYHFDLPLTADHERDLLTEAGLVCTRLETEGESGVLITAIKP